MSNKTINSAREHPVFKKVLGELISNRFYKEVELEDNKQPIKTEEVEKAIWLASIISSSNDEDDKYISSVFGILLFLEYDSKDYLKAAYIILSRSGNLISSRFFKRLIDISPKDGYFRFKEHFGATLDYELGAKLATNEIKVSENELIIASDYQKYLWNVLTKTRENIAISAPTSAGKSYIIQNYISEFFSEENTAFVLYVVPTRALISQVSEDFKRVLGDDVSINTAFIEKEGEEIEQFSDKEIFILTPERTLKLIQESYETPIEPDIVFIDEVQNIENESSRGFLLEFLLNEIEALWPKSRKIIAGPFLDNPHELFELIFNEESRNLKTVFSPVFQLKAILRSNSENDNSIVAKIFFQGIQINELLIDVDFDFRRLIASGKLQTLTKIVPLFGKRSKNIIYFPRTDWAENFALKLATEISNNDSRSELNQEINDLIELIKEEIHPEYYLIDSLKTRTAFHHGKIPEIIRGELEYLFASGNLNNIACTSTLMEGINLPAEKVFIPIAKKENIELSSFEFGNIVGRAGRIKDSLIGTVLCLEKINEDWAEEQFATKPEKDIIPAINKILNHPLGDIIDGINQPVDEAIRELEYATCFLKHKFLKGEMSLENYLQSKNLNEENAIAIVDTLSTKLEGINIPYDLLKLNPSIDPEYQNILFNEIKNNGIEDWVFYENENLHRVWRREIREQKEHKETNLFGQLENILFRLNDLFNFRSEAYFKHGISRSVRHIVFYAVLWLQNKSMRELINRELDFDSRVRGVLDLNDKNKVNGKINEVIKVYSTIISFVLVKYLKLLADILEFVMDENQKEEFKLSLSMPTMLELGTYNALVLFLISKGISRSIAIKLYKLIPEDEENPLDWLSKQESIEGLGNAYNRYLQRKGYLQKDLKQM
ncbi:DEAD/DEAH box helicase [Flagellimonas myxillae]|uniref:DEAD/DEAH box helicase n=1 Tax=Flagellimonas myxillae TaxID=2942214 RepID=UPI00201E9C08|nr:DEAD/DEAH box helicase [Muricauda myxillae]MCL6265955.1 DEAD/DEAH box helicase [Muricauda myxillae]